MAQVPTCDPRVAAWIIGALGGAGHDSAQRALTGIFDRGSLPEALRTAAVTSMFQLRKPTGQLLGRLAASVAATQRISELSSTGLLALGSLSRRSSEPLEIGGTALDGLLAFEHRASALGASDLWLAALGNARSERALPVARRYAASPESRTRAAAASAAAGVDSPHATEFLAALARDDRDPLVRARAIEVLASVTNDERRAVIERAARSDASPRVRALARRVLART